MDWGLIFWQTAWGIVRFNGVRDRRRVSFFFSELLVVFTISDELLVNPFPELTGGRARFSSAGKEDKRRRPYHFGSTRIKGTI
jgi:hypothetical protein